MSDVFPLSSLSDEGVEAFRHIIADAPALPLSEVQKRISVICNNSALVRIEDDKVLIDTKVRIESRLDLARYLDKVFTAKKIVAGPGEAQEGMFSWLGMVLLHKLCRVGENGRLKVKAEERYVLSRSSRDYYRHLVAFPYWIYKQFGDDSVVYLAHPAYVLPNVVEQFASRPYLIKSRAVAQVLKRLYWDESRGQLRPGYAREDKNPRRPAAGSILALEITLSQIQCTYDLQSMTEQQVIEKLRAAIEFDGYLNGAA